MDGRSHHTGPQHLVRKGPPELASSLLVPDVQGKDGLDQTGEGRRARGGAGSGHCSRTGGACIWPARLGSPNTLILLSTRPGAGLGNVMFQRKLFPFSPQEGKRQKDKQTPRVVYWETGQHMGASPPSLALLQMPRSDSVCLHEFIQPRTNGFHSLSREEGACRCSTALTHL